MKNPKGDIATYGAAAVLLGFGLIYLIKGSFMPYHSEAVSQKWEAVDPAFQILILALMRATSGGFIATAIAIVFLQFRFSYNVDSWIPALILVLGTICMLCSLYAIVLVSTYTPGRPPLSFDLAGEVLLIAGYFFNDNYRKIRQ